MRPPGLLAFLFLLGVAQQNAAQENGVILGQLIDGDGWYEPIGDYRVELHQRDSLIAEAITDAGGHFEFAGTIGEIVELQVFTHIAPCYHAIRLGAEFVAPEDAVSLLLTALPRSVDPTASDFHCEPSRTTHERYWPILTDVLNKPPLAERTAPWMDATEVTLKTNQLKLGTTFELLGRSIGVDHTSGFVTSSACVRIRLPFTVGPTTTPADATLPWDTLPTEPDCRETLIFVRLFPGPNGTYRGRWAAMTLPGEARESFEFRVYPDGSGWRAEIENW